jgi:hypothetical protein
MHSVLGEMLADGIMRRDLQSTICSWILLTEGEKMDFFEAYPGLADNPNDSLRDRDLRLIALSGLVYDEDAFYFEFGRRRYWGQSRAGQTLIGIGAPRVQPGAETPPYQGLLRYLREDWRCEVSLYPAGYAYLLDEQERLSVLTNMGVQMPYMLLMTAPRLGGAEIPDALVRAVYLMPVRKLRTFKASVDLLRVERRFFSEFIHSEHWELSHLRSQAWAEVVTDASLPSEARLRPVMALRSIQSLMQTGDLSSIPGP